MKEKKKEVKWHLENAYDYAALIVVPIEDKLGGIQG